MKGRTAVGCIAVVLSSFVAGCSEPVPPEAKGAFEVNMTVPSGESCLPGSHTATVGVVTADVKTEVATNADSAGSTVTCTIAKSGSSFAVNATIARGQAALTVRTTIAPGATAESAAPGHVIYKSDKTALNAYADNDPTMPCSFYFSSAAQTVAIDAEQGQGRAWLTFTCPYLTQPSTPGSICGLRESFVVVENCTDPNAE